jgi:hypothetical protein
MIYSDVYVKKRGRPKKIGAGCYNMFKSTKHQSLESIAKNLLLKTYEKQHTEYLQCKDTQTLILMLKRISNCPEIPQQFRFQPMLRLLIDTVYELIMDPFEIAVFALYLERFGWRDNTLSPHFLLLHVGYASKKYMCSDISHIQEYINRKISNFKLMYENWESNILSLLTVTVVELNESYKKLTSEDYENIVNYNFYVDEILHISPPYQTEMKDVFKNHSLKPTLETFPKDEESCEELSVVLCNQKEYFTGNSNPNETWPCKVFEKVEKSCAKYLENAHVPDSSLPIFKSTIKNNFFIRAVANTLNHNI